MSKNKSGVIVEKPSNQGSDLFRLFGMEPVAGVGDGFQAGVGEQGQDFGPVLVEDIGGAATANEKGGAVVVKGAVGEFEATD